MPLPEEVAGIRLVDSDIARTASDFAQRVSPPFLFNHALRTYLFGALIGKARGGTHARYDAEPLYLACILHDLGLTDACAGPRPFELEGADAALALLTAHHYPPERTLLVWDAIAMHAMAVADYKGPEVALVAAGAGADVVGAELGKVADADIAAVLAAFPRLNFKHDFVKSCAEVITRFPTGAVRGFMRDIGERRVPGFAPANICDAIANSPFTE